MKIKKADTFLDVKVKEADQSIEINYELIETSSRKLRSIDRGPLSDRYLCEFTFRGTKASIKEIVQVLEALRASGNDVVLSECEENYFGMNVDHSSTISTKVFEMGKVQSPVFNVYELTVSLLASGLTFTGAPTLPTSLNCLQSSFECYSEWNTHVNETYYSNNYFVDNEEDKYIFNGMYIMNNDDLTNMLCFHKTYRGNSFQVTEPYFGIGDMFGFSTSGGTHNVIIKELEYTRLSAIYSEVNISLVKQV